MLAAMSEASILIATEWFEQVWNQQDEAAIDRLFHPTGKCYGFPDPDTALDGPEAFKVAHRTFVGAFRDIHVEILDIVAEGDHVDIRWKATMTHTGDDLGFAATGRSASLSGSSFIIISGNQITEGWNHMDLQAMFEKLLAP
jgi:predicted ester cyclase